MISNEQGSSAAPCVFQKAWAEWLSAEQITGRLRQPSSVIMYEHMWSALTEWCRGERIALDALQTTDLDRYIKARSNEGDLTPRYAWRLLRLVDRIQDSRARVREQVLSNLAAAQLLDSNPAYRYANASTRDPLPSYLSAAESAALVKFLTSIHSTRTQDEQLPTWQDVRDRGAVALMLGSGITPGELRALKVKDAVISGGATDGLVWKIQIRGAGRVPAREAPLAKWAGRLLTHWLNVREAQRIPGDWLFTSTKTGKPWGKVAQFNASKKVLLAAGIDNQDGGSFKLRHTFALRQLRRGTEPNIVAQWMGITDPAMMVRYVRLIDCPRALA